MKNITIEQLEAAKLPVAERNVTTDLYWDELHQAFCLRIEEKGNKQNYIEAWFGLPDVHQALKLGGGQW